MAACHRMAAAAWLSFISLQTTSQKKNASVSNESSATKRFKVMDL